MTGPRAFHGATALRAHLMLCATQVVAGTRRAKYRALGKASFTPGRKWGIGSRFLAYRLNGDVLKVSPYYPVSTGLRRCFP